MLPDSLKGRCIHSTTITHQTSTKKRLIHFGGLDEWPEGKASTWHPLAETTIVELGEWSAPHSHCYYGIYFINFGHLTVQCVLWWALSVLTDTESIHHNKIPGPGCATGKVDELL